MKQLFRAILIITLCIVCSSSKIVAAISSRELRSIYTDAVYYDPTSGNGCSIAAGAVPGAGGGSLSSGSSVFILGDSITEGTKDEYVAVFGEKGLTVVVDGSTGRSINGAGSTGNRLSGKAAVATDAESITAAKAIVIGLGTNGGNDSASIHSLIDAVRSHNQSAPIYWIDTTVIDRDEYVDIIKQSNVAIYAEAPGRYIPISWYKAVTVGADPIQPTGEETDLNSYINVSDSYNVHPTREGSKALAKLVLYTLTGGSETANPETGVSCYAAASDGLVGEDDREKTYNYLVKVLTPTQAAAIMGNLEAEGGYEPRRVQYGGINCRGEISVRNTPSSLCDTLRVDNSTGYGIAQWTTRTRQQGLLDFAASKNKIPGDLLLQLDFLWQEMTTTFNSSVLTPLKATSDLRTATDIVLKKFECPRACVRLAENPTPARQQDYQDVLNVRFGNATRVMTDYGSN